VNTFSGTLFIVAFVAVAVAASAEPLRPGMPMPEIRLTDQHDVEKTIASGVRYVVFTRDMDAGNMVKEALAENGGSILETADAIYIADISGMPAFVTKVFAVPAMRKRGYPIVLDRDGKATSGVPSEEGKITVLDLGAGAIAQIRYVASAEELRSVLTQK
jgi:hypothetical protein